MKKIILTLITIITITSCAYSQTVYDDNYVEHPNYIQGLKYLQSSQYSSAITEFKKALRDNPNDGASIIGLFNAYNNRAVYYNKKNEQTKALSDVKSSLFFAKYFSDKQAEISPQSLSGAENNLKILENALQTASPEKRIELAKRERVNGEFAAAGYDYYMLSGNSKHQAAASEGLGDIYKIFNRPDKAIIYYRKSLAADGNNTEVHLKLARACEQTGDYASADKEYNRSLINSDENAEILASLERIWQKRVDENPKDAEAHSNLGVVFQKEKRYNEALTEYKKAEALNPANINNKINIGTLYQEQNKYDSALNTYNDILRSQPKNINVLINKAKCLKAQRKTEDAISTYKTVLNIEPENTIAKTELFELVKNNMSEQEVLDFMYKDIMSGQLTADKCYEFAYELHKAKKLDDALNYYKQAIAMNDKYTDAYVNSAQIYREKKNYNAASEMIKKAKAIEPDNKVVTEQYNLIQNELLSAGINEAGNAYESGNYQKAIETYSKINPPTADSLLGLAASYQALKQNDKAIENYKKAMELDTKNANIPYYIASLYVDEENYNEAKKYLDLSLDKNPHSTNAQELHTYVTTKLNEGELTQAIKLYDAGQYKEAVALFDKVLKTDTTNENIYYYRATAYDALKEYQKAINDYKSVLKNAPEMVIAYYLTGVDYDALGNYPAAKENYKKFVELTTDEDDYKKYAQSRINEIK